MTNPHQEIYDEGFKDGRETMRAEIERLRAALKPFAEVAVRSGWDKLDDDAEELGQHVVDAPANDIAPGAFYCLMVSAFRSAVRALAG